MKQFIVLAAVLPLLLAFLGIFSENQVLRVQMSAVEDTVYAAKEMAKQDGCFTERVQSWLKKELCRKIPGLREEDIVVGPSTDTKPVERSGLIRYRISVPVKRRDPGSLLGARKEPRTYYYVVDSCTSSEYLPGRP